MMGFLGAGNNPMVGMTVDLAVAAVRVREAIFQNNQINPRILLDSGIVFYTGQKHNRQLLLE